MNIKNFTSKVNGSKFDYWICKNPNNHRKTLWFRLEGTSYWQDFVPNLKKAYTGLVNLNKQHQELLDLLEGVTNTHEV